MKQILVTGANGFVGKELINRLLKDEDTQIYALVRNQFQHQYPGSRITVIQGDLLDAESLPQLPNLDAAYYLVHGLKGNEKNFEHEESTAAVNFVSWLKKTTCNQIIYLGALGPSDELSPHLRSRHLTGRILALSPSPCIEFRASIVLGADSTSFEMVKALCERLPFIPEFKKLDSPCQPIDLDDLMLYLTSALQLETQSSMVIEIGGEDVMTYGDLMKLYCEITQKSRKSLRVPALDDRVLKTLIDFIIPEMANVGKKLFESLDHPTVVTNKIAMSTFPDIHPINAFDAMEKSIQKSVTNYPHLWNKEMLLFLIKENLINQKNLKTLETLLPTKQRLILQSLLRMMK
jgi:uncharacterized protein YbjT (DUF2867 family)